jgi:hypothetical protein
MTTTVEALLLASTQMKNQAKRIELTSRLRAVGAPGDGDEPRDLSGFDAMVTDLRDWQIRLNHQS